MIACGHAETKKHGKDKLGNQRVRCLACGKTWSIVPPSPLGNMRIDLDTAEQIIKCLCEGVSVRATARLNNVCKQTVMDLMVLVGERCKRFLENTIRGLPVKDVQVDEAWQFIYAKEKTAKAKKLGPETGDSYIFTAIERHTKLMICWHFGKRDGYHTDVFLRKLATATTGHFQLSSDGFAPYLSAVVRFLGGRVDYGTIVKIFGEPSKIEQRRYSPAPIKGVKREQAYNLPEPKKICTSHCERMNLTLRTFIKRMARLTCAFSKKWANHEAMLALSIAHYDFCRTHGTTKKTPAVASGLTTYRWTVSNLLEKTATH